MDELTEISVVNALQDNLVLIRNTVVGTTKLAQLHLDLIHEEVRVAGETVKRTVVSAYFLAIISFPAVFMVLMGINHWLQDATAMAAWKSEIIVGMAVCFLVAAAIVLLRIQTSRVKEI